MPKELEIHLAAQLTAFAETVHRMNDHERFRASMDTVGTLKLLVMQLIEESRA